MTVLYYIFHYLVGIQRNFRRNHSNMNYSNDFNLHYYILLDWISWDTENMAHYSEILIWCYANKNCSLISRGYAMRWLVLFLSVYFLKMLSQHWNLLKCSKRKVNFIYDLAMRHSIDAWKLKWFMITCFILKASVHYNNLIKSFLFVTFTLITKSRTANFLL